MHLHKVNIFGVPLAALCVAVLIGSCASGPTNRHGESKPAVPTAQRPSAAGPADAKTATVESVQTMLQSGNAEGAANSLGQLASANPDDPELKRLQASALVSAGKPSEARRVLDASIAKQPSDIASLVMAADIARFQDDDKARKNYLDKARTFAPADAKVQTAWGVYWLDQHDWAKAQVAFEGANLADRTNPEAFAGLGQALYHLGKNDEAETALGKALDLDPSNAFTWSDRSRVRYQLGKFAEAEADLSETIARAPNASWPYIDRARFRLDSGRYAEALTDLDSAIGIDPGYFLPHLYRASIFVKTGKDAEALENYDQVVKLQPDYWYAYESAGLCAFRLSRWQAAADRFEKALTQAPTRVDYAVLATISLMKAGSTAEGRSFASKWAARLDRDSEMARWTILRQFQDFNDLTSDLENKIQGEQRLDLKAEMLFALGEYWIIRGRPDLGAKYLSLSRDLNRQGTIQFSLVLAELAKTASPSGTP